MKAVIFAGGAAQRLSEYIESYNKHLIPIGNILVIEKGLKDLIKAGIREFIVITNHQWEDIFFNFIKERCKLNSSQITVCTSRQEILPLADVLIEAKDYLEGQDFILFLGDNLFLNGSTKLIRSLISYKNSNIIVVTESSEPKHFGVVKFQDSQKKQIVHIEEKPEEIGMRWVVTGLSKYTSEVIDLAELLIKSKSEKRSLSDIHNMLINENKLNFIPWFGQWYDIGTYERYSQSLISVQKIMGEQPINIEICPLSEIFKETKLAEMIIKFNWEVKHGQA